MSAARSNRGQDGVPFALPIAKMIFSFLSAGKGILSGALDNQMLLLLQKRAED